MEEDFDPIAFEKRLTSLKDTQESIQSMSSWCLKHREQHKKIVASWLNVLKRVKAEQRLVLFYLANDVIQYSKRKSYEFVESWGLNLQKATPLVRDEKVRNKILRIFKIWEQRSVYDEEFLSDLTGLLSAGAVKKASDDDTSDFQPQQLVNKIKQCTVLEGDTDKRLSQIHESKLSLADADATVALLKERRHISDVETAERELGDGIERVERYTAALQREIVAREALLALLSSAHQYYSRQRQEVKVVAYAYKNFGARVRCLKRKLDEKMEHLPDGGEPTPSPPRADEHVPSPSPDEDLPLPLADETEDEAAYNVDKTFSASMTEGSMYSAGFSSFLGSGSMFDFFPENNTADAGSKIEVINSAPTPVVEQSVFNISDFLKNLTSEPPPSGTGLISTQSNVALPGLDLATPDMNLAPPQINLYGSLDSSSREESESYRSDPQWNNTPASWGAAPQEVVSPMPSMPRLATPPVAPSYPDTPESPPALAPHANHYSQDSLSMHDVDHRGMLPPPPPPPPILPTMPILDVADIDQRQMPPLPPAVLPVIPARQPLSHKDVDHRNLISLTSHPPPDNSRIMQGMDQDYRVPAPVSAPPDIVESVDMDLSDDEHPAHADSYQNDRQHYQPFNDRHKNNKVLVGGDNGTRPLRPPSRSPPKQLARANSAPSDPRDHEFNPQEPLSAPPMKPMINPFDSKDFDFQGFRHEDTIEEAMDFITSDPDGQFGEDGDPDYRNPSPPRQEEWGRTDAPRFQQRFQRQWAPQQRPFFRPFGAPQRPFQRQPMGRPWYPRPRQGYW